MTQANKSLRALGLGLLGVDPRIDYLKKIDSAVQQLTNHERLKLLTRIRKSLRQRELLHSEEERISAATLLIALLPNSERTILRLLAARGDIWIHEMHFSLFCFLDYVREAPEKSNFAAKVPGLVEKYLSNLKTERASAGWMAAHLMGDHWELNDGLQCLRRVVSRGKHVVGRELAIRELITQIERERVPANKELMEFLNEASVRDRSPRIRSYLRRHLKSEAAAGQ